MTDEPRTVVGEGRPRVPVLGWPLFAVLLIGAAGLFMPLICGKVGILVPTKDLSAYHRLETADLETKQVWRRGLDDGVAQTHALLEGRVTRRAIGKGERIRMDELTQAVDSTALTGVQLALRPARSSSLGVKPGDRVRLRLAPTTDSADLGSVTVGALLLDAAEGSDGTTDYVVVLKQGDVKRVLAVVGRSELFVTPIG
jgi:Flp pilus assembly protein CpaB